MNIQLLEDIGLDKNEIKVYLALLELGLSTTGFIIKKSGIPSSRVYGFLQCLIEKGLASYSIIKNTRYFKAADPERLFEFMEERKKLLVEKEDELRRLLPELKKKQELAERLKENEQQVQMFEGIKGIKTALDNVLHVLKKSDEFIVFGAPRIGNERLHGFFNDFHKRRAKKGINYRVIYNSDAREFGEERKIYSLTKVKYLHNGMNTPSVMWVYKDYVVHVVFTEDPAALVIKNRQIAKSSLSYFEFLWKQCKE